MFHYHYIKVIADSENMRLEEITFVLQKYFAKQNDGFTSKSTWMTMPLISMAAENGSSGWKEVFCG